ncbi:MAG TPA: FG-GAP repeat protein, partial [Ilumatobacteraceae bacterium]|nr:FG-GAP repeat protein [Ilumatobacteraceae bacterium]
AGAEVSYDWGDVTEWYRTVPDGIEHGYTIDAPISATDDLTVTVAVADGTPTLVGADTVSISRPGSTPLWYRGLIAFDANGTDLPAEMGVVDGDIELRVDTAGAVYPVTIDPVIADAQVVRVTPITQVVDSARAGNLLGGIEAVSSCPPGTLLTGLTVYQTPDGTNWIRAAVPRCTEVVFTGATVSLGAGVVVGPDFGDPTGFFDEQTADCPAGSAVTGFAGNIGDLVDTVELQCSPLGADGTVGAPLDLLAPIGGSGGVPLTSPVTCATSFANGLQGRRGQDLDALGLQCATVRPGVDTSGDRLGYAVDVDGNRMVASAPFADVGAATGAGKVYVYERFGGLWVQTAEIVSPTPEVDAAFGDSLDLSGDHLAVGESNRFSGVAQKGRVWAFSLFGGTWSPNLSVIESAGPVEADLFGASIAWIEPGQVLLIGAPGTNANTGEVYVAAQAGPDWALVDQLSALPPEVVPVPGDEFGYAVAYDESTDGNLRIAVGIPGRGGNGGALARFRYTGFPSWTAWEGTASGYAAGSRVGTAVDVEGNTLVVAGYGSGPTPTIRWDLFEFADVPDGSSPILELVRSSGPGFPVADGAVNEYLDLDGDTLAIGRPGLGGAVALFRRSGGVWPTTPTEVLAPSTATAGDRVGRALALDGTLLVTGAPGDDGPMDERPDSGAVYTYRLPATATFINPVTFAAWENPANWDTGVVPGAGDAAIVPFGTYPELGSGVASTVDTLSVTGQLRIRGNLRVETSSTIATFATVDLQPTATFDPSGDVTLDGELSNSGPVVFDGPGSITGTGRFINGDELRKTGPGT